MLDRNKLVRYLGIVFLVFSSKLRVLYLYTYISCLTKGFNDKGF